MTNINSSAPRHGALNLLDGLLQNAQIPIAAKARLRTIRLHLEALINREQKPAAAQEAVAHLPQRSIDWLHGPHSANGPTRYADAYSRPVPEEKTIPLYAAPVAAAPVDYPDSAEDRLAQAIDERDSAEGALGAMFRAVTGRDPEWSSAWGFGDAIEEAEEHVAALEHKAASTPAAPGIDPADPWRGLYAPELMPKLDGVDDWIVSHPDLPQWPDDEERGIDNLIKAQGFAFAVVGDEYPDDDDASGGEFDTCAWLADWKPEPPAGAHWRLVMVHDTEDGPAAVYVRPLALIDATPKGGSDAQMVPYQRALDLIGDAYNAGTHGIGYSQQAMELHDALQATSAEVGA